MFMTFPHAKPVIAVIGDGIDLGQALEKRARRSIVRMTQKYIGHLIAANVYFNRDGLLFRSTLNIQMGGLGFVTSKASHQNCYRALRAAMDKAEKQLRRMKRRLRDDKPISLQRAFVPAGNAARGLLMEAESRRALARVV
jgi:ribosomal subunit interface protein